MITFSGHKIFKKTTLPHKETIRFCTGQQTDNSSVTLASSTLSLKNLLYLENCTLYNDLCNSVLCTVYFVLSIPHPALCILYYVLCTLLYSTFCTLKFFSLCSLHFVLGTVTLYSVLCTLSSVFCILNSVLCTAYSVLSSLYSVCTIS
jgi:hypothetical protein